MLSQIFESPQYSQIKAQLQLVQQQTTQNMISQAGLDKMDARAVFQIGPEENGIFSQLVSQPLVHLINYRYIFDICYGQLKPGR